MTERLSLSLFSSIGMTETPTVLHHVMKRMKHPYECAYVSCVFMYPGHITHTLPTHI